MNNQETLERLEIATNKAEESMNRISDFIKTAENLIKNKGVYFDVSILCRKIDDKPVIKWDGDLQRIIYVRAVDDIYRPLIETQFSIRKEVVETHFTELLHKIIKKIEETHNITIGFK